MVVGGHSTVRTTEYSKRENIHMLDSKPQINGLIDIPSVCYKQQNQCAAVLYALQKGLDG